MDLLRGDVDELELESSVAAPVRTSLSSMALFMEMASPVTMFTYVPFLASMMPSRIACDRPMGLCVRGSMAAVIV